MHLTLFFLSKWMLNIITSFPHSFFFHYYYYYISSLFQISHINDMTRSQSNKREGDSYIEKENRGSWNFSLFCRLLRNAGKLINLFPIKHRDDIFAIVSRTIASFLLINRIVSSTNTCVFFCRNCCIWFFFALSTFNYKDMHEHSLEFIKITVQHQYHQYRIERRERERNYS